MKKTIAIAFFIFMISISIGLALGKQGEDSHEDNHGDHDDTPPPSTTPDSTTKPDATTSPDSTTPDSTNSDSTTNTDGTGGTTGSGGKSGGASPEDTAQSAADNGKDIILHSPDDIIIHPPNGNGEDINLGTDVVIDDGAIQTDYNIGGVQITHPSGGSQINTGQSSVSPPTTNPALLPISPTTGGGTTTSTNTTTITIVTNYTDPNTNQTVYNTTTQTITQTTTMGPSSDSPQTTAFPGATFDPSEYTIITHDYIEEISADNFHATHIKDVTLGVKDGNVVFGILTAERDTTVTINNMQIQIPADQEITFYIVDDQVYLNLEGENIEVENQNTDVACVLISHGSHYKYTGTWRDPFAVWNPNPANDFELCIRTEPGQDFSRSCANCGLIDFLSADGYMRGIYEYEKQQISLPIFKDIITADNAIVNMIFDFNIEKIEQLGHRSGEVKLQKVT